MDNMEGAKHPTPQTGVQTRKQFLKRIAGLAAGGVAGGALVNTEISAGEQGVVTPYGTYKFLYEKHYLGIAASDIPPETKIFFREFSNPKLFAASPADSLLTGGSAYTFGVPIKRIFPDPVLVKLSQIGSRVMLGDIGVRNIDKISQVAVAVIEYFTGGILLTNRIINRLYHLEESPKSMSRRNFLGEAIKKAGMAWMLSAPMGLILNSWQIDNRQSAFRRILGRLEGLQGHLHPEYVVTFFRDLVIADKLLTVGKDVFQSTGKTETITSQLEYGHSGIEDLLRAGPEFCRTLIVNWPLGLKDIIELNGGIEKFASARILKLPVNLKATDISAGNRWSEVSDQVVTDIDLVRELSRRLPEAKP